MMFKKLHSPSSKKENLGFSLAEMIVAIGIFTAVMFVATGALLAIVGLNKKAQAQQSAINNLNFALENMARSIRTGSSYRCYSGTTPNFNEIGEGITPSDCNGGNILIFRSDRPVAIDDNGQWGYWLSNGVIYKGTDLGATNLSSPITAGEIYIEGLKFYVIGTNTTDQLQPKVIMTVSGYAFVGETQTGNPKRVNFDLQTTASQRRLDI